VNQARVSAGVVQYSLGYCLSQMGWGECRPVVNQLMFTIPRSERSTVRAQSRMADFALGKEEFDSSASIGMCNSVIFTFLVVAEGVEAI
jgi:hypothetical protein